jgi:hypothetical protein
MHACSLKGLFAISLIQWPFLIEELQRIKELQRVKVIKELQRVKELQRHLLSRNSLAI